MTKIELFIKGAEAEAEVNGPLTGGMVGAQVEIRYNSAWDGLSKTLVCRSCVDGTPVQEVRTVANVGLQATVAHEVMIPGRTLYLGVEGRNADGTVVFPTIWACCGTIHPGANADADPTVAATPEAWEQVLLQMGSLDELNTDQKGTLVAAINEVFAASLLSDADIPTKVSQLENDAGYAKHEDIPEHTWESLPDKPFGDDFITVLEEITVTQSGTVEPPPVKESLVLGETYILTVDGVEYTCISFDFDMMGWTSIGTVHSETEDYTEPNTCPLTIQNFSYDDSWYVSMAEEGTHTISIKKAGGVKTLEEIYLPYKTEEWTFTLEYGSAVTKQVVVK